MNRHPGLILLALSLFALSLLVGSTPACAQPTTTAPTNTLSAESDYNMTILPDPQGPPSRPRVGLVLSGGGAKGLAHIGVLKVIEEAGLDIDVVTGTSMGSIIGGLYAIGYTSEEIDSLVVSIDWADFFAETVNREHLSMEQKLYDARYLASLPLRDGTVSLPNGLIPGQNFSALLNRLTLFVHDTPDFHNLPRPFACIATDLVTGVAVVLDHGNLSEAIRASMAIPSIFTPVPYQGSLLVDGGMVRNFPAQDALDLGADILVGVNVGVPLNSREKLTDIISIVNQSLSFIGAESDSIQRTLVDILIEPPVAEFSITDFYDAKSIIQVGEETARTYLPQLRALADSLNRLGPESPRPLPPRIDSVYVEKVEIHGLNHVTQRQVMADFAIDAPRWVTTEELEAGVERVFSSQFFERVGYNLQATQRGTIVTLNVLEKHSDFFRFGFRYDSFDKAGVLLNLTSHNLIWNSTMATLDLVLGEYTEAEAAWFFHTGYRPRIGMRLHSIYQQAQFLITPPSVLTPVEMKLRLNRNEFLAGTIFSTTSAIGGGVRHYWSVTSPRFSVPGLKRTESSHPALFALLWEDSFDRADFATDGSWIYADFEIADPAIGGDVAYRRGELSLENRTESRSWLTLIGRLRLGSSTGTPPLHRLFFNEPFDAVIGAEPGQLAGKAIQVVGGGLQFQPWRKRFLVVEGSLGNSFASWNTNLSFDQYEWGVGISAGASTVVGPISASLSTGSLHDALFAVNVGFHF
ncbi:patatin-like phospholipase family protein [bacterium]|nr:patatin-like phospholipase family protein [bacterium]